MACRKSSAAIAVEDFLHRLDFYRLFTIFYNC